jgi:glycosyltransferase involved in cell wall biosynthesis
VPEVIEPNVSGWVVTNEDEAVAALSDLGHFDRRACRRAFERSFTAQRMARDYVEAYARLAARNVAAGIRAA